MHRRNFLRIAASTSLLAAPMTFLLAREADTPYLDTIGIGLYTVRHQLEENTRATIQAIKEMGYQQVEPFGFPDCQRVIAAANEFGLKVNSTHFTWNSIFNPNDKGVPPFEKVLEAAHTAGLTHLVIATIDPKDRTNLDAYRRAAEKCNQAAVTAKAAGIQLAYHNHSFEFEPMEGGKAGYDVLIEEFATDMQFQVDVFWAQLGKRDPAKLIQSLKGRVSQVHLKDLRAGVPLPEQIEGWWSLTQETFAELGQGIIPMKPILEAAQDAGVKYCHVEQDLSPDPLRSIRQSLAYLRSL